MKQKGIRGLEGPKILMKVQFLHVFQNIWYPCELKAWCTFVAIAGYLPFMWKAFLVAIFCGKGNQCRLTVIKSPTSYEPNKWYMRHDTELLFTQCITDTSSLSSNPQLNQKYD